MPLTKNFTELSKSDADIAGGKGASLGEMTQAGIPVPPGFVVLSEAFEEFIHQADLVQEITTILDSVDHKEVHTVDLASEKIRELILRAKMPADIANEINMAFKKLDTKYVAVRSSATAEDGAENAWAGQLESYLNTEEKDVLKKIQLCWSSLFTPRAIFYRFEKGLNLTKISVAVVVQKMVESEVSGIAFSVHPVTENPNQLIIEAGFGLGEAIVSGSITPDSYVVEKEPRKVLDINISTQTRALYRSDKASAEHGNNDWVEIPEPKASSQVLNEKQILELSEIILGIEKHYGFPCDIEWAFEKDKFYIVQSRPITTLKKVTTEKEKNKKKDQNESLVDKFFRDRNGAEITKTEGNFSLLFGEIFASIEASPFFNKYFSGCFGSLLFVIKERTGAAFWEANSYTKSTETAIERYFKSKTIQEISDYSQLVSAVNEFYASHSPQKLKELSEKQLKVLILKTGRILRDLLAITLFSEALDEKIIKKYFEKIDDKKISYKEFFEKVILQDSDSFIALRDKILINHKKSDLYNDQWILASYAYVPKLSDSESLIKKTIEELGGIKKIEAEQKNIESEIKKNQILTLEFRKKLTDKLKRLFDFIKISSDLRDVRKKYIFELLTVLANSTRELFARMNFGEDDYLSARLKDFEKDAYKKPEYPTIIAKRKAGVLIYCNKNQTIEEYVDYDGTKKEIFRKADKDLRLDEIKGSSAGTGTARGTAKIILSTNDFGKFKDGDILVTGMTRPEFIPLMKKAVAIVTDEGGVTCHAAIISRELGLPCVIGTKNATRVLHNGDLVEVDADAGVVRILTPNKQKDQNESLADRFIKEKSNSEITKHEGYFSLLIWGNVGSFQSSKLFSTYYSETESFGSILLLAKKQEGVGFFDLNSYRNFSEIGLKKYLKSEECREIKDYEKLTAEIDTLYNIYCPEKLKKISSKQLETTIIKAVELLRAWQTITIFCEALDGEIVKKYFEPEKNKKINYQEFFKKATLQDFESFIVKRNKCLINHKKSTAHRDQWVISNYFITPVVSELENLIQKDINELGGIKKIQAEQIAIETENKKNKVLVENFRNTLPPRLKKLFDFVKLSVKLRDTRKEQAFKNIAFISNGIREIFSRINIPAENAPYVCGEDIESGRYKDADYGALLKKRKNGVAMYYNKNEFLEECVDFDETKDKIFNFIGRASNPKEIKGNSACDGKARGHAKIILTLDDFSKFETGDILVTSMTRPEFVPLLKGAVAVVTDEGGITCHAAIISRELNIPCVIGTKNATRVLHDGDLVEVDADTGVVRILNKQK